MGLLHKVPMQWMCGFFVAIAIVKALGVFVQRKLKARLTALEDIPLLGLPRKSGRKIQGTAIICGGSIAGLLSARVCSDHFEHVIIVEPEEWVSTEDGLHDRHREAFVPGSPAPRRSRVLQYNSIHAYQVFNDIALRKLFMNYDQEMHRAGGRFFPHNMEFHLSGVPLLTPHERYPDGIPTCLNITRPGYETTLRKLVLNECSNIRYIVGSVTGLVPYRTKNAVASVVVRTHSADDNVATEIPATLVVDCTGPAQAGLKWLHDVPFQARSAAGTDTTSLPLNRLRISYDPKVAYSTCEFDIPSTLYDKIRTIFLPLDYENKGFLYTYIPDPKEKHTAFTVMRREGSYLQMMCGGCDYRGRITSVSDIRDYISKITSDRPFPQYIYALLDFLEEEDIPATYFHPRISPRSYVQYSRASQLPANFIALGDSVLQLNPIRGQGCTKACIDAVTLNALLARTNPLPAQDGPGQDILPADFGQKFFSVQAQRTGSLWEVLKRADYAYGSTVPEPGDDPKSKGAFERVYASQLVKLAVKDQQVASDLWHVDQFLAPPTDLLSPRTMIKVSWAYITQILGF